MYRRTRFETSINSIKFVGLIPMADELMDIVLKWHYSYYFKNFLIIGNSQLFFGKMLKRIRIVSNLFAIHSSAILTRRIVALYT